MQFLADPDFWSTLSSAATILGFAVVIYTAVVALGQLKEMTRARHLEAMLQVYEMIGSEEARKHRRFIYTELESKPEELTPSERKHVEQVSVTFDRIGKLVESGLIPRDELLESHCEVIIRSWKKLEPYILYHRHIVGGRHAQYFEHLAATAQEYHSRHFPGQALNIVDLWPGAVASDETSAA
ncbi:MAG: hypothetical protein WA040_19845 [Anaerolineae bacterium]